LDLFQAIVLGIVQGLTEFLPISSSGHLRIVPAFAGWDDPGAAFTAVIQLGTMAAVVLYFRNDLVRIAAAWLASLRDRSRRPELDARLGWYLIVGTVPIVIFGVAFSHQIENGARDLYLIGTTLILLGLLLLAAEKVSRRERDLTSITRRDAIVIGFAQALALIPGVSRSGATITAGLFLGMDRVAAARFSFLLSIPAVVLSGAYELRDVVDGSAEGAAGIGPTAVATLLAFISGYLSIAFLLKFLTTHTTGVFVAYRIALGAAVLVLAGTGAIA
jgi:undecaprenyl-diphosphatase